MDGAVKSWRLMLLIRVSLESGAVGRPMWSGQCPCPSMHVMIINAYGVHRAQRSWEDKKDMVNVDQECLNNCHYTCRCSRSPKPSRPTEKSFLHLYSSCPPQVYLWHFNCYSTSRFVKPHNRADMKKALVFSNNALPGSRSRRRFGPFADRPSPHRQFIH